MPLPPGIPPRPRGRRSISRGFRTYFVTGLVGAPLDPVMECNQEPTEESPGCFPVEVDGPVVAERAGRPGRVNVLSPRSGYEKGRRTLALHGDDWRPPFSITVHGWERSPAA